MSLGKLVMLAPVSWLSSSLGNDYILSILSPPCSFQTGLHSASVHMEKGGTWVGCSRASSCLTGLSAVPPWDTRREKLPPQGLFCLESGHGWALNASKHNNVVMSLVVFSAFAG